MKVFQKDWAARPFKMTTEILEFHNVAFAAFEFNG